MTKKALITGITGQDGNCRKPKPGMLKRAEYKTIIVRTDTILKK